MIVVRLELWPGGNEERKRELGVARISNDVQTTVATSGLLGSYRAEFCGGVNGRSELNTKVWKKSSVRYFDRTKRGAWDLLYLALHNAVGKRNGVGSNEVGTSL